mgnify:CR=1 FL=1
MKKALTILASGATAIAFLVPASASAADPGDPGHTGKKANQQGYTPPALDWGQCDSARLQRAGADPAFGSGPLATVVQDLLSIAIYLALASVIVG